MKCALPFCSFHFLKAACALPIALLLKAPLLLSSHVTRGPSFSFFFICSLGSVLFLFFLQQMKMQFVDPCLNKN